MENYLSTTSFKNFEDIPELDIYQRAKAQNRYLDYLRNNGYMNYRLTSLSGCGPVAKLGREHHVKPGDYVSLVSNDYLGFTQHDAV